MPLAVFGIDNTGINLAVNLLILLLVVLWLALVYRTWQDARLRIEDPLLVGCAFVAALIFPFIGTLVYLLVRPPEYLDDVRERELEMQAAEARLHELDVRLCPHCDHFVERDFLRCPNCLRKIKEPCVNCSRPLDPEWRLCPYCEHEVGAPAGMPTAARRRRRPSTGATAESAAVPPQA
jgi:RNA polymerase subunit RPABC4/transcription elongation factor Spt4